MTISSSNPENTTDGTVSHRVLADGVNDWKSDPTIKQFEQMLWTHPNMHKGLDD